MKPTLEALRNQARAYPEAYEESPWGDLAAKVNGKVFAFYGSQPGRLSLTVKLPMSGDDAKRLEGVVPTGYGLGKHGWISANLITSGVSLAQARAWIEESYRAVAPKRLGKTVPQGGPEPLPEPALPVVSEGKLVHIVSEDRLRAERLIRALATHGVRVEHSETTHPTDIVADLIVVDVGRSAAAALEAAGELALIHFDVPLLLAGIKDAKTLKKVSAVGEGLHLHRQPPGDPAVVDAILAAL